MAGIPAFVRNGRFDILYANPLAEALYSEQSRDPVKPPNSARFVFLDPRARTFYVGLGHEHAHDVVAASARRGRTEPLRPRRCPTSSACSRRGARSSASSGLAMTSASTAPAPSGSTTRSSAT